MKADLVIASNRGPLSFALDHEGRPVPAGSAGGLAAALHPLLEGSGATWVACAMSDADRMAAAEGLMSRAGTAPASRCGPTPTPTGWPTTWCRTPPCGSATTTSSTWPAGPRFDHHWAEAWEAYREFNELFAAVVDDGGRPRAPPCSCRTTTCAWSRDAGREAARPAAPSTSRHTPFAEPRHASGSCPAAVGARDPRGHGARRPPAGSTRRAGRPASAAAAPTWASSPRHTFVSPLDPGLRRTSVEQAASAECRAAGRAPRRAGAGTGAWWCASTGSSRRRTCCGGSGPSTRCSRMRPELARRGRHAGPRPTPRVDTLAEYLAYGAEVEHAVARVNDTVGDRRLVPDHPRRGRRPRPLLRRPDALRRAAREPACATGSTWWPRRDRSSTTTDGVLALSREAGAFDELHAEAARDQPLRRGRDGRGAGRALAMPAAERARRAAALRGLVSSAPGRATGWPTSWPRPRS